MSAAGQSRDSTLQPPWWMHPWQQPLPEFPDGDVPLSKALEVPVLGPGSASPSAVPNPYDMSGGGSPPDGSPLLGAAPSGVPGQNGSMMAARTLGWGICMSWSVQPSPRGVLSWNAEHLQAL